LYEEIIVFLFLIGQFTWLISFMKIKPLFLSLISIVIISNAHSVVSQTTSLQPVLKINPFIQKTKDTSVAWVAITAERKIIELFSRANLHVVSHLIRSTTTLPPTHSMCAKVSKKDSLITLSIDVRDSKDSVLASGKIKGTDGLFRRMRSVVAETMLYALDINDKLQTMKTVKMPAKNSSAYGLYLLAKREIAVGQYPKAIQLLLEAVNADSSFALACWTMARLYEERGVKDSVSLFDAKAQQTDAMLPGLAYKDSINREQPLKDLFHVSKRVQYDPVDTGMAYKFIELEQYGFTAIIWKIDSKEYGFDVQVQNHPQGNYIQEFFTDPQTILAVNGGFFEMDGAYTLSPSGLVISGGAVLSPAMERGGSGVFCVKKGKPAIVWAKENINPAECSVALQCGPVIVEPGAKQGIVANDYIRLNRAAIGICGDTVIIAMILGERSVGLSLYEFAEFLRTPAEKGGAGCDAALNLDGGSSTQARLLYKSFVMNFDGLWRINNAITVKRKK